MSKHRYGLFPFAAPLFLMLIDLKDPEIICKKFVVRNGTKGLGGESPNTSNQHHQH